MPILLYYYKHVGIKLDSLIDQKRVIVGIISIFGLTILMTFILTSFSTSEQIKTNLFNLNYYSSKDKFVHSSADNVYIQHNSKNGNIKIFTLVQDEFGFNGSNSGPPIEVNKGDIVKINIINTGDMAHTFGMGMPSSFTMSIMKNISGLSNKEKIESISYDTLTKMPCPECKPIFEEGHVQTFIKPGEMVVTTFNASEAGNYKYFCMVRGHIWMGMNGPLIVKDVDPIITNGGINA